MVEERQEREMGTAVKNKRMAELGKLGGKLSGVRRREKNEVQSIARKVLATKVKYPAPLKSMLDGVGIDTDRKPSLIAAIFSTFAMRALTGDLKSAYFVMDIAGVSARAREHLAKIKVLEKMTENSENIMIEADQSSEFPESQIRNELKNMGIYDQSI